MPEFDWIPPEGMESSVRADWRRFYRDAMQTYGISAPDYRAMYLAQQGRCYICRTAKGMHPDDPKGTGSRRLGIDHNHLLGNRREAVRGLLCTGSKDPKTCNRLIGYYSSDQLVRAVEYLRTAPGQRALQVLDITVKNGLSTEAADHHIIGALGLGRP